MAKTRIMAYLYYLFSVTETTVKRPAIEWQLSGYGADSLMDDEFIQLVMTGIGDNQISVTVKYDSLRIKKTAE